ncbi:hypothetical protein KIL84_008978 [Mauremys mutica]|uniref:Uncharacterized protein n=1 Tax=Mauremys mutica TaxID=74926 RepID=A0A9D3XHP4_9SAUR|nr:hypothetical protein KIL84_008978 [Mauremys mutica]
MSTLCLNLALVKSSKTEIEAVMPPPPTKAEDFKQFQDLTKRVVDSLQISLEKVKKSQHKLLDILHTSSSARIALFLINEALLRPIQNHLANTCHDTTHM